MELTPSNRSFFNIQMCSQCFHGKWYSNQSWHLAYYVIIFHFCQYSDAQLCSTSMMSTKVALLTWRAFEKAITSWLWVINDFVKFNSLETLVYTFSRASLIFFQINGENVTTSSHEHVVDLIRRSGELVSMTVISAGPLLGAPAGTQDGANPRHYSTLPRKLSSTSTLGIYTAYLFEPSVGTHLVKLY